MSITDTSATSWFDDIAHRIVDGFHPDRIILFGSHARGEAVSDSDIDLLVIMPVQGSRRRLAVEIGAALCDMPMPKDIVVTTPEDFAWRKDVTGTVEYPAAHEGRVLYANP
uniref:Nucleotidyltransferase domain-containing protein n=1 Tax=Candidatus Kentrum sp. LPFa TaxID=2126335 RepID=A0A450WL73_9GAMM|nr:MAG: Nucleotidyltransferase domain-containing protein [Candidatus Kentron sp. LPFa]